MEIEMRELDKYSDVLTLQEVSDYLKISKDTTKKMVEIGLLDCIRVGKLYRFTKFQVLKFLKIKNKINEED